MTRAWARRRKSCAGPTPSVDRAHPSMASAMPSSSQPNASLTVWDSVSSHLTLGLMFWATLIFMPLIVFYTSWAYRVMRGKVTLAHIRANEHTAY